MPRRTADDEDSDSFRLHEIEERAGDILRLACDDRGSEGDGQLYVLAQLPMLLGADIFRVSASLPHVHRIPARIHPAGQAGGAEHERSGDLRLEWQSDSESHLRAALHDHRRVAA